MMGSLASPQPTHHDQLRRSPRKLRGTAATLEQAHMSVSIPARRSLSETCGINGATSTSSRSNNVNSRTIMREHASSDSASSQVCSQSDIDRKKFEARMRRNRNEALRKLAEQRAKREAKELEHRLSRQQKETELRVEREAKENAQRLERVARMEHNKEAALRKRAEAQRRRREGLT